MLYLIVTIAIGAGLGALLGRTRSCETGACPLTANPRRGALWGGFLGLLVGLSLAIGTNEAPETTSESTSPAKQTSLAKIDPAQGAVVHVKNAEAFDQVVGQGRQVIKFTASWCPPCKVYAPIFEQVAGKFVERAEFYAVDVDEVKELSRRYAIEYLPTTVILVDGKEVDRKVGVVELDEFEQML